MVRPRGVVHIVLQLEHRVDNAARCVDHGRADFSADLGDDGRPRVADHPRQHGVGHDGGCTGNHLVDGVAADHVRHHRAAFHGRCTGHRNTRAFVTDHGDSDDVDFLPATGGTSSRGCLAALDVMGVSVGGLGGGDRAGR
jgi:hypothetical protein